MSKAIDATLLAHKALSSTTLTDLLLIGPLDDASYRGFTLLDFDVTYDPGDGAVTFKARTGMEMSALQSASDLGVDNAEANTLYPVAGFEAEGFTDAQIDAGALDKIPFVVYRVNYNDLTSGRHEIIAGGTIGEIRRKVGGMTVLELRSLSQQLKQTVGRIYSLTCPATFGSQPIGTGGGVVEERAPCGKDVSSLWVTDCTVTDVDADEPDLVFADSSLTQDDDYFKYGVVTCTAGANAGQTREIESFSGGQFVLQFPFTHPVALADTFDARPGCSKLHQGENSCRTWFADEWVNHFRGMPHMPVAEATKLLVPGAALTGRYSGTGEETNVTTPPSDGGGTPTVPGDTDPGTARTRGATIVTVSSTYGNGSTDATTAIQNAIDSLPGDGGTVVIPDGTYLVQPGVLTAVSKMWLKLSPGATIKSKYTAVDHKAVFVITDVDNVEVSGGTIQGYRPLWSPIVGTTSEWGHCITVSASSAVTIHDITLKDGVGDGISVGGHSGTPTDDLVIDNVRTDNNRRQGLSLVWATNVVITDSTFANTNGTSPECGIDIEPENGQEVSGVLIENCKFETNAKYGINLLKRGTITATVDDITIKGCTIGGSVSAGNLSNGIVTINASNVTVQDSTIAYNHVTGLVTQNTASLTVTNNVFKFNRTNGGIDSTDTAHLIASGLNSPGTDAHIQIKSAASGQSITNNTFYY